MRKRTILPTVALSLMTFGMLADAAPVGASTAAIAGEDEIDEDGEDSTQATLGGGAGAPSGGAATGAGGTAPGSTSNTAPLVAAGVTGIGLLGLTEAARRRRAVGA